ncbi:MAG TPA: hypothetical protein ENN18_11970 [Proteobacteria bacterium]|nr:hypothetical protein [Pseudomonadota bacterium]
MHTEIPRPPPACGGRGASINRAFICLKMELQWRSNPIGKVRNNLPFLKELANKNFTQSS